MTNGSRQNKDFIGSWSLTEGLDEILRKSATLMAAKGFHGTSMRDLAQETGRSLSGLYHYFRSKEDLLFLINSGGFTTLNTVWRELVETIEHPHEKLFAFIYFHISYFVEHMDEMRVMTWGTQTMHLEKARVIQKLKDRYTDGVKDVVRGLSESCTGQPIDDLRLARQTYLLFGMMNWTFTWYSPKRHGSTGDLIKDIYRTFVSGIGGKKTDEDELDRMEVMVGDLFRQNKTSSMWSGAMAGEDR